MMIEDEMEPETVPEAPALEQLDDFEFPADEEFAEQVRRSIQRREATSHVVDLSVLGLFSLILDYVSTILSDLFSIPESEDGEKES